MNRSFPQLLQTVLEQRAAYKPLNTALVCGERRLTYAELELTSNRLAHFLIANDVEAGDRVAICLGNQLEAVVSLFAVLKAGAAFVLVHPSTKAEKLSQILAHSQAKVLVASTKTSALLQANRSFASLSDLKHVIKAGLDCPTIDFNEPVEFHSFFSLIEQFSSDSEPPRTGLIDQDLAALVYRSDADGQLQGVMHTHRSLLSTIDALNSCLGNTPEDILLNVLPLSFDYGMLQVFLAFNAGGTLVLEDSFAYPHAVLKTIIREGVTGFAIVPTISAILCRLNLAHYDLSHLRYLCNTGGALPTDHLKRYQSIFPHLDVVSLYGNAECGQVLCATANELLTNPKSAGRPLPNLQVGLRNSEGHPCVAGETGELIVRGSSLMSGYWNDPAATAERLTIATPSGQQLFQSNDFFSCHPPTGFQFEGTSEEVINSRGEKINPRELELVLLKHDAIAEAVVLGEADDVLGQAIRAVIVPKNGYDVSDQEVLAHCRLYLEDYLVPGRVEIRETLPKTATGTIDKSRLQSAI